jgi:hypothetical protein
MNGALMKLEPAKFRARIWSERRLSLPRSARSRRRVTYLHWYLSVTDGKRILYADNCRDVSKLYAQAEQQVFAFRTLHANGMKFPSWAELVEQAHI